MDSVSEGQYGLHCRFQTSWGYTETLSQKDTPSLPKKTHIFSITGDQTLVLGHASHVL